MALATAFAVVLTSALNIASSQALHDTTACNDIPVGYECTPLINKGTDATIGELFHKRVGDISTFVTNLFTVADTGHTDAKLCLDDDDDPFDDGTSCLGSTAGTKLTTLGACPATTGEEDSGKYEYFLEGAALTQSTIVIDAVTLGLFTACTESYEFLSLHFNQGEFSVESFFTQGEPEEPPAEEPDVSASIVCVADEEGNGVFTLDVDAPEGVTTSPADGAEVENVAQDVEVTWDGGTFSVPVTASEDCSAEVLTEVTPRKPKTPAKVLSGGLARTGVSVTAIGIFGAMFFALGFVLLFVSNRQVVTAEGRTITAATRKKAMFVPVSLGTYVWTSWFTRRPIGRAGPG